MNKFEGVCCQGHGDISHNGKFKCPIYVVLLPINVVFAMSVEGKHHSNEVMEGATRLEPKLSFHHRPFEFVLDRDKMVEGTDHGHVLVVNLLITCIMFDVVLDLFVGRFLIRHVSVVTHC